MGIIGSPAIARRQAIRDLDGQVLKGSLPDHGRPRLPVFEQPPDRSELGVAEFSRRPNSSPHQPTQVILSETLLETALDRARNAISGPIHRQGDGRRTESGTK
jgi:hypothetical protein